MRTTNEILKDVKQLETKLDLLKIELEEAKENSFDWGKCLKDRIYFYVSENSKINRYNAPTDSTDNHNVVPTEKHARSILAFCQLSVIIEAINEKYKRKDEFWYNVYLYQQDNEFEINNGYSNKYNPFRIESRKGAETLIKHHKQLLKDYFMID